MDVVMNTFPETSLFAAYLVQNIWERRCAGACRGVLAVAPAPRVPSREETPLSSWTSLQLVMLCAHTGSADPLAWLQPMFHVWDDCKFCNMTKV